MVERGSRQPANSCFGGGVARWPRGSVAAWLGGGVARWRCGSVAVWLGGGVARWRCGSVAVWLGGPGGAVGWRLSFPAFGRGPRKLICPGLGLGLGSRPPRPPSGCLAAPISLPSARSSGQRVTKWVLLRRFGYSLPAGRGELSRFGGSRPRASSGWTPASVYLARRCPATESNRSEMDVRLSLLVLMAEVGVRMASRPPVARRP